MDMISASTMVMNHAGMDMDPTTTSAIAAATSPSMDGMGMSMGIHGGGSSCKISMLWNWYTVDACFISKTWRITSRGMFAGSCIGVICLVMSLELLRRIQREYDRYIKRQDAKLLVLRSTSPPLLSSESISSHANTLRKDLEVNRRTRSLYPNHVLPTKQALIIRQLIRASIHMLQFGVAYFVMLLAMYYNGYFIIMIIIGAFLGAFVFSWDQLPQEINQEQEADITGCCG